MKMMMMMVKVVFADDQCRLMLQFDLHVRGVQLLLTQC